MEKPTPWRANSPQVSRFTDGKLPARLGNRQGGETNDREQSSLYLVAADEGEHFEQSRAYRFSRDCDTRGMNERSGFHTTRLGRSAQCGLDRDRIERGQRLERGRKREEMFPHSVDPHVPGDRSFDMIGARNNAMTPLGVLYGYGSAAELRDAGALHLCATPR